MLGACKSCRVCTCIYNAYPSFIVPHFTVDTLPTSQWLVSFTSHTKSAVQNGNQNSAIAAARVWRAPGEPVHRGAGRRKFLSPYSIELPTLCECWSQGSGDSNDRVHKPDHGVSGAKRQWEPRRKVWTLMRTYTCLKKCSIM